LRDDFRHEKAKSDGGMTNEHTLLERARQSDNAALGELYDRYAPRIYVYVYRRIGDARLAEDLTGDVFVRVVQALRAGQSWHTSFQAWLYRIAHNLVVDYYRRRPAAELELDEQLAPAAIDDDLSAYSAEALERGQVRAALEQLTPEQQQVLALRFGEELTARETAEVMGKNVGAIEALQHRALAALRRVLGREL
jgi:RNA polymerase sigma-70 factor (ECF subfamily)